MSKKLLCSLVTGLLVSAGTIACTTSVGPSEAEDAELAATITACPTNADDTGFASLSDMPATPEAEASFPAGSIRIMGVLEDTGCKSITISDPRSPPKHPPLKTPLPADWNTRCPAYGPPANANFDLSKCTASSPTLMECPLAVGAKTIKFECRRDTPGGKGKANGAACNFHCYVKEGQK